MLLSFFLDIDTGEKKGRASEKKKQSRRLFTFSGRGISPLVP